MQKYIGFCLAEIVNKMISRMVIHSIAHISLPQMILVWPLGAVRACIFGTQTELISNSFWTIILAHTILEHVFQSQIFRYAISRGVPGFNLMRNIKRSDLNL